ncbi:MAG: bifunctional diguanylate cyclase/phosphodiesterase [Alkalibacterium sp.]|nr:bifunctional diguanylate cyclase/phosphodiesterase [Alkalibacterium sp.]
MTNIFGWILNVSTYQLNTQVLFEYMVTLLTLGIVYYWTRRFFKPAHVFSIVNDPLQYPDDEKKKEPAKGWIQAFKNFLSFGNKKELFLQEEIQKKQNQLNQVKYFDMLTKLPNRVKLMKDFKDRLTVHTDKDVFAEVSIFILDIDRFRTINELHGREAGDRVLIKIIERLRTLLGERAVIARESEDEIYILIENVDEKQTLQLGRDIVDLFTKPFKVNHSTFYVTASVGISRYPETAQDMEALLQQAEIAMYKVKHSGKNNYHLFMTDDAAAIERKRRIEFGLKEALLNNELYLVYQPKVEMDNGHIYGVEALLRWENPILGLVSPVEFIPIAEESGMINEIGYWVIYEAVRQAKEWQKQNMFLHIAVNVSALQFEDPYFVTRVKNVLELYDVDASQFIVEITESIMQNVEHANRVIKDLHKIGVSVAIDDFGTGYSSLSVLNNVFIDIVKIDKSFIDHVISKENTASLVKTMIQMGKSLNFKIIAEGIESLEQSDFLRENLCEYGQGYFYSKPVSPSEVTRLTKLKLNESLS